MSVEDIVNKGWLKHYGKFTLKTICKKSIYPLIALTVLEKEEEEKRKFPNRRTTFLEQVIEKTVRNIIFPAQIVSVFVQPYLLGVAAVTNLASIIYEYKKDSKDKDEESEEDKESIFSRLYQGIKNIPKRVKNYVLDIPSKFKRSAKRFPRKAGLFLSTYALTGAIALSHFAISNQLKSRTFNPKDVNFSLYV